MQSQLLFTSVCFCLLVIGSASSAESKFYLEGQEQARKDIKSGEIKYMMYGLGEAHVNLFGNVLKKNYKITLVFAGNCEISADARDRADGYNEATVNYLKEKTKKDIIEEAYEKARKLWEQERALKASKKDAQT